MDCEHEAHKWMEPYEKKSRILTVGIIDRRSDHTDHRDHRHSQPAALSSGCERISGCFEPAEFEYSSSFLLIQSHWRLRCSFGFGGCGVNRQPVFGHSVGIRLRSYAFRERTGLYGDRDSSRTKRWPIRLLQRSRLRHPLQHNRKPSPIRTYRTTRPVESPSFGRRLFVCYW